MTAELVLSLGDAVKELTLIPSHGGIFELTVNDSLVFSKKALGRFPEKNEVLQLVKTAAR